MRQGIHPDYADSTVHCSCGNKFQTRSTKSELHIELCDKCHPFYTGQQKFVDTGGRVQRFSDKFGGAAETVLAKEQAAREARQKAHEEAAASAKAAREIREAAEAEKASKAAARGEKPKGSVAEEAPVEAEAVAEAVVEETAEAVEADAVEETVAEESAE